MRLYRSGPVAAETHRAQLRQSGSAGPHHHGEVHRTSAAVPSVGDLRPPGRGAEPQYDGRWVDTMEDLLRPLYDELNHYVLMPGKVRADDTPVNVLQPGSGKTRTGRLWVYVRDDRNAGSTMPAAVWFSYSSDRKGIHPQQHLAGYSGILQADAYAGYNAL